MEDSANTLLYTGTYVIIFIIATSMSIMLYFAINRYADSAFEYSQNLESSIINVSTTGTELQDTGKTYLTPEDVFSYYVNYVKKDQYSDTSDTNQDVDYIVRITNPKNTSGNIGSDKSYSEVMDLLKSADKYYLLYEAESTNDNGKKEVDIRIAPVTE